MSARGTIRKLEDRTRVLFLNILGLTAAAAVWSVSFVQIISIVSYRVPVCTLEIMLVLFDHACLVCISGLLSVNTPVLFVTRSTIVKFGGVHPGSHRSHRDNNPIPLPVLTNDLPHLSSERCTRSIGYIRLTALLPSLPLPRRRNNAEGGWSRREKSSCACLLAVSFPQIFRYPKYCFSKMLVVGLQTTPTKPDGRRPQCSPYVSCVCFLQCTTGLVRITGTSTAVSYDMYSTYCSLGAVVHVEKRKLEADRPSPANNYRSESEDVQKREHMICTCPKAATVALLSVPPLRDVRRLLLGKDGGYQPRPCD